MYKMDIPMALTHADNIDDEHVMWLFYLHILCTSTRLFREFQAVSSANAGLLDRLCSS
jgi:hypothetical protein